MIGLDYIRRALADRQPRLVRDESKRPAAVAMVLCDAGAGLETLFIERARREGDPWSGHLAFPGGREEAGDATLRATAERETLEEIGLDLQGAEYLGQLDDMTGSMIPVVVSGYVYHLKDPGTFRLDAEVQDAFWVSVEDLLDSERHTEYRFEFQDTIRMLPAIDLLGSRRPVLWGLTYRFVAHFFDLMGQVFPVSPE